MSTVLRPPCLSAANSATGPANFFATPDPLGRVKGPKEISAWLDKSDRVVHLSSGWDAFAPPDHRRDQVLTRPVNWFVDDESARHCFRALFERIRGDYCPAKIVARCDHADGPRAIQLMFVPHSAGAIEITWSFFAGAMAQQIPEVPRRRFHDQELLRVCGWCHDVHMHSQWHRLEHAAPALGLLDRRPLPRMTHGICSACSAAILAEKADRIPALIAV